MLKKLFKYFFGGAERTATAEFLQVVVPKINVTLSHGALRSVVTEVVKIIRNLPHGYRTEAEEAREWLPLGFRLVGGADFNEPLVVVKVNDNSFAEDAGVMVGDVVVRINETPTAGITHVEAHELINRAGCEFVMAVRRGLFSDLPVSMEEESNSELEDIFETLVSHKEEDAKKDQKIGPAPTNPENLATVQKSLESSKPRDVTIQRANKSRKWSTFLVKPKNPKPETRRLFEERQIIGEPYKVKIIKQPKRDPNEVLNHPKKSVQFEPIVTEVEISRDTSIADSIDSLEISEMEQNNHVEIETSVEICEESVVEVQEFDEGENGRDQDVIISTENGDNELTIKKINPILKPTALDIHIDASEVCESSLSLEQQLAAVQKQLLALSQLPTAIQVTLEAVTQQLNKIVLEKGQVKENGSVENGEERDVSEASIEVEADNLSLSENAEGDLTQDDNDEHLDELEEDVVNNGDAGHGEEEEVEEDKGVDEDVVSADPYAGLTEEEKEARIIEEQLLAKKQKIEEERRKMDWTQRPIVLPGGRKWSDPEDITPKYKTPKMSDEKICKAIEDHSEVIVDHWNKIWPWGNKDKPIYRISGGVVLIAWFSLCTVPGNLDPESQTAFWFLENSGQGCINFLKFQPPPKNLDYLQKSEVYRLIHDMDPPVRGVGARAEKILSEKDYYGDKGAP